MKTATRHFLVTARWFTAPWDGPAGRTAHSLAEGGTAACSRKIIGPAWNGERPYWKSDMPEGVVPCLACEDILAGERLPR